MIRGLIFDFDGLILDTEMPRYQAWAETYERHGRQLSLDFWRTLIGRASNYFDPVADLERQLGIELDREALRAERRLREQELVHSIEVLPGVREWREDAVGLGLKLGVASSSSREWVVGHLSRLGLDAWDCIRCRDDVDQAKPAPDVYQAVLACMGIGPDQAIAVEDSTFGVRAAKSAGLYCVAVPSTLTAGSDFTEADLLLESLADMPFEVVAASAGARASA